ncbi:MAG: rhodanese-like domain-containing protein [Gammaproteobacteria bacterium]|nr:rhodanese-like domain-containing protein [Gammaproteobacteria bacterium]
MSDTNPKTLMDFVQAARARIKEIDSDALERMLEEKNNLLLLDVREPSEHEHGHLQGAHLVPRGILEAAADLQFPKHDPVLAGAREQPVVVYCATGGRSAMAAEVLQMMGFQEVYSLAGGFMNWAKDQRPVVREASYV